MEGLTPVTLVVKAPNQKVADHTVVCALDWTVKKLKEHLSKDYPSKPAEKQQRIIYSGKLLQDDVTLKEVLRQYEPNQTIHTVHLVCSPSTTDAYPQLQSSAQPSSPSPSGNLPSADSLRHRYPASESLRQPENQQAYAASPFAYGAFNFGAGVQNVGAYPGFGAGSPFAMAQYSPEQLLVMQQYMAQYMAQYMQYYQAGGQAAHLAPPYIAPASAAVPENAAAGNGEEHQPAAAAAPAADRRPRQPEVVRMNAQGGPVIDDDDDDAVNRDWLDWSYVLMRFVMLLCILYFYSSFSRFITTAALVIFIYLYQMGWFHLNRRAAQAPVPPRRQVNVQDEQQRPEQPIGDNQNEADAVDDETAGTETAEPQQPQQPQPPGVLTVAWTFVVSFFSSLAPQLPPPINAN